MHHAASSRPCNSLEDTAEVTLELGRLLMESGASARYVEESMIQVAIGFGADRADVRVGYASLTITIGMQSASITTIQKVWSIGVNQKLHHQLSVAAAQIGNEGSSVEDARVLLERARCASSPHPPWVVAIAVGVACAAFGRLLDVDWAGIPPVFAASAVAQMVRRQLARHRVNLFLSTTVVAFVGSALCGVGARLAGSQTVARDMVTTVLLLVPGVPAFNAQLDILEGRPTLGSARAVWVMMVLIFMSAGVWIALGVLGEGR